MKIWIVFMKCKGILISANIHYDNKSYRRMFHGQIPLIWDVEDCPHFQSLRQPPHMLNHHLVTILPSSMERIILLRLFTTHLVHRSPGMKQQAPQYFQRVRIK